MTNPLISVQKALYGVPGIQAVDVTSAVQTLFDQQYARSPTGSSFTLGPISPQLFGIPDPSSSTVKTFTINYSFPVTGDDRSFARGGQDGDSLTLAADTSQIVRVVRAFYGAGSFGLDLTQAMADYFAEPGNPRSLVIGSDDFFNRFCGGSDPADGTLKFFSMSLQPSPTGHITRLSGFDGQTVDVTVDYVPPNQTWMSDLATAMPAVASLPLRRLCLPTSHDSGACDFSPVFTPDNTPWIRSIMALIKTVTDKIDVIPYVSKFINPADWAYDDIAEVTTELATATHSDILQQLNDGIRCLDLRVYYNNDNPSDPFAIYHGLLGIPLSSVFASIAYFVEILAPQGEIVYVTMGHYLGPSGEASFTPEQLQQLATLVWGQLDSGQVFGPQDLPVGTASLFDCTYAQIAGTGNSVKSKVILVAQALPNPPDGTNKVWAAKRYSPPDQGSGLSGGYTNTDSAATMVQDQQAKSTTAKTAQKPFPLYLTLTPQDKTITLLVASHLRNSLLAIALWVGLVPVFGWGVSVALLGVAAYLALLIAGGTASYDSLESLSSDIFDQTSPTVGAVIANKFTGGDYAVPTFIYMDFYEQHTQVDSAGRSLAQLVETAQSICVSNAG